MSVWTVSLDWEVCPDGVELVDQGPGREGKTSLAGRPSGEWYRYRSKKRRAEHYPLANLENPIVLHFINAIDEESRRKFLTRFGIPVRDGTKQASEETVSTIKRLQANCRLILGSLNSKNYRRSADIINRLLASIEVGTLRPSIDISDDAGRMSLKAQSLYVFMAMEMMLAMNVQAKLAECAHCKTAFLTGSLTGRRSHAKYCSDRCRVAAMRVRQATAK